MADRHNGWCTTTVCDAYVIFSLKKQRPPAGVYFRNLFNRRVYHHGRRPCPAADNKRRSAIARFENEFRQCTWRIRVLLPLAELYAPDTNVPFGLIYTEIRDVFVRVGFDFLEFRVIENFVFTTERIIPDRLITMFNNKTRAALHQCVKAACSIWFAVRCFRIPLRALDNRTRRDRSVIMKPTSADTRVWLTVRV